MKRMMLLLPLICLMTVPLCGNVIKQFDVVELPANKQITVPHLIKLEKGKAYEVTGKAFAAQANCNISAGFLFYDSKKFIIHPHMVNVVKGSETKLVKPAIKGEKTIVIADNNKFNDIKKGNIVAFNVKKDMSDLPNRQCEYYIVKKEKSADGTVITFSRPLSKNYPAGTLVRLHFGSGLMRFAQSPIKANKNGDAFSFFAKGAQAGVFSVNDLYFNASYARVYFKSDKKASIRNLEIKIPAADTVSKRKNSEFLEGPDLHAMVKPFRAMKVSKKSDGMEIVTSSRKCGFYQMQLNWQADKIKQLEFTVKSDTPGFFSLAYGAKVNGKHIKTPTDLLPLAVMPDGKYHTIIFDVAKDPRWQGTITNWELSWYPDTQLGRVQQGVNLGLQRVHASEENNRIPDIRALKANEKVLIKNLFPRTQCRLFWKNGNAPELTLQALDHNMKLIPDWQVKLPANGKFADFTCHENMVWGVLSAQSSAAGYPVISQLDEYCRPYGPKIKWRGNWIWSQKGFGKEFHNVWFEKEFILDEKPLFGAVAFMGDDQCYIYVNGNFVESTNQFRVAGRSSISKYLKKGKNRITARVFNETQNAGLVVNCYIKTPDKELYIDTDKTWRCDPVSNMQNQIPNKIDRPVFDLGNANTTKPWAGKTDTRYAGPCGVLDILEFTDNKIRVKVLDAPKEAVELIRFKLTTRDRKARFVEIPVFYSKKVWKNGDIIDLKFNLPYWSGKAYKLEAEGNDYIQLVGKTVLQAAERPVKKTDLQQARFVKRNNRTMIQFGNRLIEPIFSHGGGAANRHQWHEFDIARRSNIKNFRLSESFMTYWKGHDKYDFTKLDEKMNQLFTIVPDAVLTIQLGCIMPDWWLKENPDDVTKLYNNAEPEWSYDRQALGSKNWLKASEKPIRALIEHIKNGPYADRLWSLTFTENGNGEWFWWRFDSKNRASTAGFSKSDYATFRSYLKEKYSTNKALAAAWKQPGVTFENAMMPNPARANKGTINTMLDPAKDMQLIDWYIFRGRTLAEAIIHFSKTAKEASDGKLLTGAYYGYFTELSENAGWKLQVAGHNGFLEVAKSPYVDFVQAPTRYLYRKVGMSDQLMQPFDTYLFYGKQVYCEQDMRTATGQRDPSRTYSGPGDTVADSIGHLNRAVGMMLATGTEMYYYDNTKGALSDKVYRRTIADQINALKKIPSKPNFVHPEVAVIGHRESSYMIKAAGHDGVFTGAVSGLFRRINELAVPYRSFSLNELLDEKLSVPAHKVYIMLPTLVLSKTERQKLLARFEKEEASVVWLYAAAPIYPGKTPSAANNADFLNVKYRMQKGLLQPDIRLSAEWGSHSGHNLNITGPWFYPVGNYDKVLGKDKANQAVLVSKKMKKSTHYLSTLTNLPMEFYAKLFRDCGVHSYLKTQKDAVWVGNNVLFVYAKSDGRKTLALPENCQAKGFIGPFSGVLNNNGSFEAVAGQTYGFILQKAQ